MYPVRISVLFSLQLCIFFFLLDVQRCTSGLSSHSDHDLFLYVDLRVIPPSE